MALTDEILKGMVINVNNAPHLIIEREFYKPGKGNALIRIKIKNLKDGRVLAQTYRSGDKVEEVEVITKTMQYMYTDEQNAYFMDPDTFEQVQVGLDMIDSGKDFLHESGHYIIMFYQDEAISVKLPPKITLEVLDTSDAVKGNTATNATKEAKMETGASIQVPLFIKRNERIIINTENREYVSKE